MPVKLNSSGGGSVTLTTPSTATDYTATFPASTGTVLTTGAAVTVAQGGTGQTSFTANGLLYASGTTTLVNGSNITYDGNVFTISSKQSQFDANYTSSGGINIVRSYAYNNNTANTIGSFNSGAYIIYVSTAAGQTPIPVFTNGGAGVAWYVNIFDPDVGTFVSGAGPTMNFTQSGTGGNTFSIVVSGAIGTATIQRTAGSMSYTVYVQILGGI